MRIAVKLPGQDLFVDDFDGTTYDAIKKYIPGMLDHGQIPFVLKDEQASRRFLVDFFCDDEGLIKQLPPNFPLELGPLLGVQAICGPVVFVGPTNANGDATPISHFQIQLLELFFESIPKDWDAILQEHIPEAFEPRMYVEAMTQEEFLKRLGG